MRLPAAVLPLATCLAEASKDKDANLATSMRFDGVDFARRGEYSRWNGLRLPATPQEKPVPVE